MSTKCSRRRRHRNHLVGNCIDDRLAVVVSVTQTEAQDDINSIPVLGTEPASENRIRSCCGSTPGIRFYCKPVTLVRCREIRGEIRFSGRVVGKWLCEMTSSFIINELRGARALRLFCGRSSFPPPIGNPTKSKEVQNPLEIAGFLFFKTTLVATIGYLLVKSSKNNRHI